ncbi:MAG: hypothetical protein P8N50_11530 [Actinomycetota bacterium]|jgi:hypothetical protein|nr:hypothetical protein [Actinomycetota bacterium]
MIDVIAAIGFWILVGFPFIMTAAAFLDAARRPEWCWAMARRRRAVWMGMIVGGGVSYFMGPIIAIAYWFTARRDVAAVERGEFRRFD